MKKKRYIGELRKRNSDGGDWQNVRKFVELLFWGGIQKWHRTGCVDASVRVHLCL